MKTRSTLPCLVPTRPPAPANMLTFTIPCYTTLGDCCLSHWSHSLRLKCYSHLHSLNSEGRRSILTTQRPGPTESKLRLKYKRAKMETDESICFPNSNQVIRPIYVSCWRGEGMYWGKCFSLSLTSWDPATDEVLYRPSLKRTAWL